MRYNLLFLPLLLIGCGGDLNKAYMDRAEKLCEQNEGIHHISIYFSDVLVCNNGAIFAARHWKEK